MPLGALFVGALVIRGTYRTVERVFLVACLFYVSYLLSGFLAHPVWGSALLSTVRPTAAFNRGSIYMIIGLVGTTIAPWMQFYLQSAVQDAGSFRLLVRSPSSGRDPRFTGIGIRTASSQAAVKTRVVDEAWQARVQRCT